MKTLKEKREELKGKIPQFIENNLQMEEHKKIILFGKFCKLIDESIGELK